MSTPLPPWRAAMAAHRVNIRDAARAAMVTCAATLRIAHPPRLQGA